MYMRIMVLRLYGRKAHCNVALMVGPMAPELGEKYDKLHLFFVCGGVTVTKSACGTTVDCGADVVRTYVLTGNENGG
jgi:hypothetical protein